MKRYVVYDSMGHILRTGYCADEDILHQAKENELVHDITEDPLGPSVDDSIHHMIDKDGAKVIAMKPEGAE